MIIIYGTRMYGTIDTDEGFQHATRFIHIYYLPLIPIGGARPVSDDSYIPEPMQGKSVLLAYARVWGFFALGGLIAATYLNLEDSFISGGVTGAITLGAIGLWAFLMLKAGVKRSFSAVGYALTLGVPLLALGIATFTGVGERTRRMKWEMQNEMGTDDFSKAALMKLAKEVDTADKNDKLAGRKAKCEQGDGYECNELGYSLKDTDKTASLDAYRKGCDLEYGMACFNEALVIAKTNENEALMLYEQACDLDYADGCNNLATRYEKKEPKKAVELFQKGCELKSGLACRNLGQLTSSGTGTKKNPKLAKTFFKKGCDLGDSIACGKQ
ncbi:MAG: tetratricopeptide repeat protein [Archangium sp.]